MVSTRVIHVIARNTIYLQTPKGWKAELASLVDPQWTLYPQSGHMLGSGYARTRFYATICMRMQARGL